MSSEEITSHIESNCTMQNNKKCYLDRIASMKSNYETERLEYLSDNRIRQILIKSLLLHLGGYLILK